MSAGWGRAGLALAVMLGAGLAALIALVGGEGYAAQHWVLVVVAWAAAWLLLEEVARLAPDARLTRLAAPLIFGGAALFLWETITRGAGVPTVLLPPPSMILGRMLSSTDILWADFQQTFLKSVLAGYALGNGAAILTAVAIDRSPFLQKGLAPVGGFISALPIVGAAPIMVMWFGFDWPSKAAVVVLMVFFPTLVNTIAGLAAADRMQRDLMRTYAAGYWTTMLKLRLPMAAPFIFNALKITTTLALIGAIVSEFFGTPTVGMGFRISTEVGRMNVDMVWAEIVVAALAGSAFYGLVGAVEKAATFWRQPG